MNKPSVLFVVSDFDMGGITTSLRNLTDVLIREGHRVGIVNLPKARQLPDSFHPDIELIPLNRRAVFWNLGSSDLKNSFGTKKIALFLLAFLKKITNRTGLWQKIIFHGIKIEGYEVAVAFRQSPLCYRFVKKHVNARRRIGFWHGDPDYMDGVEKWISCLQNVDDVACVSNAVRDAMKRKYPAYTEKYKTVYNVFCADEILQKSLLYKANYGEDTVNLVTVSRIDFSQKQIQFIPHIARRLKEKGLQFHWTVVGDGPDLKCLRQLIREKQVEELVTCTGNKSNPFPYVAQADLFVMTSVWEAYGMVLTESLILHTPCVAGDYPALREIIKDGVHGLIAENSPEGIEEKIEFLLTNPDVFDVIKKNVSQYRYSYRETYHMFMEICQ